MSARTDPPVRIDPTLLNALREMAERNGTGIATQASRVLMAGFRALGNAQDKELDAAHQALNASGIPMFWDGKPLKLAARIRIMHEKAEAAIVAAVIGNDGEPDGPNECNHSDGESCPACTKSTNPDEPLPY